MEKYKSLEKLNKIFSIYKKNFDKYSIKYNLNSEQKWLLNNRIDRAISRIKFIYQILKKENKEFTDRLSFHNQITILYQIVNGEEMSGEKEIPINNKYLNGWIQDLEYYI